MNNTLLSTPMDLDPKTIPASWHHCFNERCPRKDECLRFFTGKSLPPTLQIGLSIFPNALVGETCAYFAEKRIENLAWGLTSLFAEVKKIDERTLREQIKCYLGGHSAFYRYKRGEYKLNTKQQEWILALFQKHGYNFEKTIFDHYTSQYVFTDK